MADIKFRCPECTQKIAVDPAAVGMTIECPACRSSLVIPASSEAPVRVLMARKLVNVVGGASVSPSDTLAAELVARQKQLDAAVEESKKLRDEGLKAAGELKKAREQIAAIASERDRLLASSRVSAEVESPELAKLKTELADARRERDEQATKVTAIAPLREQLSSLTSERAKLLVAVSEAKRDADALRAEVAGIQSRLGVADRLNADLTTQVAALKSQQEEAKTKAEVTLPAELAAAREETEKVRAQFGELARSLDAARLERDQIFAQQALREQALVAANTAIETARNEIHRLRGSLDTAAAERERLSASAAELTEETRELEQRVDGLLDRLHATEREAAENRREAEAARHLTAGYEDEIRQMRAQLTAAQNEVARHEGAAREAASAAAQSSSTEVEERLSEADKRIRSAEAERDAVVDKLDKTSKELAALQEQLRSTRVEKEQNRSRVHDLQSQMNRGFDHVGTIEAERDTLRSELEAVKTGLERAKQHVSVLQARRDVMREEINQLRAKLGIAPDGPPTA